MSNEEMIAAIKACAEKLGRAPTTRELSLATESGRHDKRRGALESRKWDAAVCRQPSTASC